MAAEKNSLSITIRGARTRPAPNGKLIGSKRFSAKSMSGSVSILTASNCPSSSSYFVFRRCHNIVNGSCPSPGRMGSRSPSAFTACWHSHQPGVVLHCLSTGGEPDCRPASRTRAGTGPLSACTGPIRLRLALAAGLRFSSPPSSLRSPPFSLCRSDPCSLGCAQRRPFLTSEQLFAPSTAAYPAYSIPSEVVRFKLWGLPDDHVSVRTFD